MKNSDISVILCSVLMCLFSTGSAKKGFILTAPKALDAGSLEYFTFTVFGVSSPKGTLLLQLLHWYTDEVIASTSVDVVSNRNMWVEMAIPPTPADLRAKLRVEGSFPANLRAKLRVEGSFGDGFRIDAVKEVLVRHSSVVTFVQTDKPVYKPGQTVRFRVLPLNSQLRPLAPDTVADIWIEDPSNIRVSQWMQVKFTEGIVQLELPLSDDPPLGAWTIKTTVSQVSHSQTFHVEKYVLPKFDVKVNPPAFIMADADSIPLEICAWYSYGKKVDGTFKMKVTYKKYAWESKRKPIPSVEHSGMISGCQTVHVNTQDILLQTRQFGFRTLEFAAEVSENTTALTGNATATSEITHSPLKLKFLSSDGNSDYFKPGIPFYGELSVHRPNDVPAPNERIEICAFYRTHVDEIPLGGSFGWLFRRRRTLVPFLPAPSYHPTRRPSSDSHCRTFTTDKRGRVRFSVPPKSKLCSKITLEAKAVAHPVVKYREDEWIAQLDLPHSELHLRPWYTPSGHQVQIEPHPDTMECERLQRVRVRYTAHKDAAALKFYHQVMSRGRIVQQGSHQRTHHPKDEGEDDPGYDLGSADPSPYEVGEFLLSFDSRAPVSPAARLLVFYVRGDGEIVADSRKFKIANCLPNKVQLHFRHEQQYPNTEASLLLSAAPNSACGIGLVDKSVTFLGRENQFNKENIFKVIEKYDVGKENAPHQVTDDYCMQKEDAAAGSDASFPLPPSHHYLSRKVSEHVDTAMAFEEAGMVVISNFDLETRPCVVSQPVAIAYNFNRIATSPDVGGGPAGDVVNLMSPRLAPSQPLSPVPKIAEGEEPPQKEEAEEIRSYFPETWLWEMHTVGPSGETALKRVLPHTVTRWVGGAVCVHPKSGLGVWERAGITAFQPFFLAFRLPYSVVRGEAVPLTASVFNYLEECLPIKLSLEPSADFEILSETRSPTVCVCGGESASHLFTVRPRTLGSLNVTLYGFSLEEEEDACGTRVTARLGARDAVTRQLLVEAEGFPKEEVFNYFVCPETTNGSYAAEVDLLLPEDVVEGSGRAHVSVTGDLLGPSLHGGLGRLVRLPVGCGEQNMVLFTPNILVLDYLEATSRLTPDIRAECVSNMKTGYQRELKYRHADGSYSAFGARDAEGGSLWLTAFVLRSFGQARRFMHVDEQDLGLSTAWILSKQFENGCFEPSGFMLNKAMKGGLESGGGHYSLAPLTAYVLISLLEGGAQRPELPSIRGALACLRADAKPSTYALALFAYAAVLAKEPAMADKYFRQLEARAIVKGSQKFWDESGLRESVSGLSVGVETAGYYVLARMAYAGMEASAGVLPVIRWIAQQRNADGGFVSTQDTVVALQALARYSSLQTTTSPLDMGLVVEGDELVKGFKLEEANRLVTQTAAVPALPAVLDLQAVGEGCAMVQFSLRYHVSRVAVSEAFDLSVDARSTMNSGCKLPRMSICMRYKIPDQTSNMVVVAVKMASGFVPDEGSLDELQSDSNVQLMRHEIDGNQVNLYFNEITNEEKCFKFFIRRDLEVNDIQPSSVKLYDYYQPELEITKEYRIPSVCTTASLPQLPTLPALDDEGAPPLPILPGLWGMPSGPTTADVREKTPESTVDLSTVSDSESTVTALGTSEAHLELVTDEADEVSEVPKEADAAEALQELATTVSDDIPPASEAATAEAGVATSITPERLVEGETEDKTTAGMPSEEQAVAENEETATEAPEGPVTDKLSDELTPAEASSDYTTGQESIAPLDDFSNAEFAGGAEDLDEVGENQLEMADDASNFQIDDEHLVNFVDREESLDFPDGIEGNLPVTVLPPIPNEEDIEHALLTDVPIIMGCPVCAEEFSENFMEIYCNSTRKLRILIRDADRGWAKILQDLSHQPKSTKTWVKLKFDRSCPCPQLLERDSTHLVMGGSDLWDTREIRLARGVLVLKSASRLKVARKECSSSSRHP